MTCTLALAGGFALEHRPLLDPATWAVGRNPAHDVQIMTWSLAWWPWAVSHGADPLRTSLLWSPHGFPTLWITSVPAAALALAPLTLLLGPLVSYNVAMVLAVVAAAAAMHLLCDEITGDPVASVAGALLFALSPYLLGHLLSQHLNLVLVFPLPLLARLAIRRARGAVGRRRFCLSSAALLALLAGCSTELLADLTLVVAAVALLSLALGEIVGSPGPRFWIDVAAAYACALPVLVPLAVVTLLGPHGTPSASPADYSTDAANLLVPTPTTALGALGPLPRLTAHFAGNIGERDGYLGLPLILVAGAVLLRPPRRALRLAGIVLAVSGVLSLGPVPTIGGRSLLALPVSTASLPVLRDALPARLSLFADLAAACLFAVWIAHARRRRPRLLLVGGLVGLSLLPNMWPARRIPGAWAVSSAFAWSSPAPAPLAETKAWRRLVPVGSSVLVLPALDGTAAEYWQATDWMRFRLLAPETPFVPPQVAGSPVVAKLAVDALPRFDGERLAAARLRRLLATTQTRAVVVAPDERRRWQRVVAVATQAHPVRLDGALLYPVPARLQPLTALGEAVRARAAGRPVRAWVAFDGVRGAVRAAVGSTVRTISSAGGDADAPALATAGRRIAVAFTEWRAGTVAVRVATEDGGGWHTTTVGRNAAAVWSPRVALVRGGVLAAWVDVQGPQRELVVRRWRVGGTWSPPWPLSRAEAVHDLALRVTRAGQATAVWQERTAGEWRLRAAVDTGRRWHVLTLAASTRAFARVRLERALRREPAARARPAA